MHAWTCLQHGRNASSTEYPGADAEQKVTPGYWTLSREPDPFSSSAQRARCSKVSPQNGNRCCRGHAAAGTLVRFHAVLSGRYEQADEGQPVR